MEIKQPNFSKYSAGFEHLTLGSASNPSCPLTTMTAEYWSNFYLLPPTSRHSAIYPWEFSHNTYFHGNIPIKW
jgi:hypothetical protein